MRSPDTVRHRTPKALAAGLAAVVCAGLAGPAAAGPYGAPGGAAPQSGAVSQAQATAASNPTGAGIIDRVLVRIDGRPVLHSEFEAQWQQTLAAISAQVPQAQIDAQTPQLRGNMMAAKVQEVLMEIRAEELGYSANPNDIDRGVQNVRETNDLLDDDAWQQALAASGMTEADLRAQIAGSIVQQQMVGQELGRKIFVFPREIETYYQEHTEEFEEPEQVLFQQLVFTADAADRPAVRERAENALTELRAGISLSAVGNKYSAAAVVDAAAAGWLSPVDLQPEILAAVNNLTPLDYSEIIEGRFGYYILQLMDRKEGRILPLEEVRGGIEQLLQGQKMNVELQKYTAELLENASIEIYAEEFNDLHAFLIEGNQGAPAGSPGRGR